MKTYSIFSSKKASLILMSFLLVLGCQNNDSDLRDIDATISQNNNPDVFIDTFSGGLDYAAFGGSDYKGFQVDSDVTYNGSSASMRFDVPNVGDPDGGYTGGTFFSTGGRNLSGYNVLTFWAKALQASTIEIGFGLDNKGSQDYKASCTQKISTTWKKYYLPIPDASKLTLEKGLLYVSAGAKNGDGFTFWLDEVKYENLDDIILQEVSINDGIQTTKTGGIAFTISGLKSKFSLPNGSNQVVQTAPNYFTFSSDNTAVAKVSAAGIVEPLIVGTATINAKLGNIDAVGSLLIVSTGAFVNAPTPREASANVISIFSDAYTNVLIPIDQKNYYNGYWAPYQKTQSDDFTVGVDHVLNYTDFNFVGIQFVEPTIDATSMTYLHMDIFIPGLNYGANFKIEINDFGADGVYAGTDNTSQTYTNYGLVSNSWNTIDIPLTLANRAHLAQLVFSSSNIANFYADNIYFYK